MQDSELKLHFDQDKDQKVVFDQPYYYYAPPEGGTYDENSFYKFQDGSFLTNDGYFFNNIGYDRYGGQLDKNFNYTIKESSLITKDERAQLKAYPFWEPNTEDYQVDLVQDEEKYQAVDKRYSEVYKKYKQYEDQQDVEGGDDIFFKRQAPGVKYQLKGAKGAAKHQPNVAKKNIVQKQNNQPQKQQQKKGNKTNTEKAKDSRNKVIKDEKVYSWDFDL